MKPTVIHADSRDALRDMADASIDACVCDPPYALVSIGKRYGADNAAPTVAGVYGRSTAGFMGKKWDTGETAFDPAFWAEVLRVLKPGAHLVAFGGTRTYHRLVCAIEDAGFEIRDQLAWLFGSGFPKSHDVSKGIDKRPGVTRHAEFAAELKAARFAKGFTNSFDVSLAVTGRRTGAVANWEKYQWPEARWWPALRDLLEMSDKWDGPIAAAEREKTGERVSGDPVAWYGQTERGDGVIDVTAPATDAARQWQGWGTALKPAHEPICLARKPLIGTVAANVLQHGTGALNINVSRIGYENDAPNPATNPLHRLTGGYKHAGNDDSGSHTYSVKGRGEPSTANAQGRWPANVIHDGSEEVLAHFPESNGQSGAVTGKEPSSKTRNVLGLYNDRATAEPRGDTGSAARFFYTAKADADDRLGSKHPTVKPVDLMAYLVKLVTPPGGVVLDPFAGSGTTGMACMREGFECILIEREAEYVEDIKRRILHVRGEDAPLFAGLAP